MSEFLTLSCPTCSGKLQITEDIDRFACAHCGNEHVVKRSGGIVSLKPVFEAMSKGVDNTASELAIARLDKEIDEISEKIATLQTQIDASAGYLVGGLIITGIGVALWIGLECATAGFGLIIPGIIGILMFVASLEKKPEKEKLQEKLKELKTNRKAHYDKVNNI
ncbi:MAG: hypothetical protein ACOX5F_00965 [Anaerovoracaceae bacterium]|jgi:hypothetical protein